MGFGRRGAPAAGLGQSLLRFSGLYGLVRRGEILESGENAGFGPRTTKILLSCRPVPENVQAQLRQGAEQKGGPVSGTASVRFSHDLATRDTEGAPLLKTISLLLLLSAFVIGCDTGLSDKDADRLVDTLLSHPDYVADREESADRLVEALMSNQSYVDLLEDDKLVEEFANAMMAHPTMQTTPEEDCATLIVMAVVSEGSESGNYAPPSTGETDRICEWYAEYVKETP